MAKPTSDEIIRLIKAGESETVEFKSNLPPDHVISKVLSAFANTKGGTLLIGVNDKGQVVGLSKAGTLLAILRLGEIGSSLMQSSIQTGIVNVAGKEIVYATIEKAPETLYPISTSRGEFYRRVGPEVVAHSFSEVSPAPEKGVVAQKRIVAFVAMSFREEEEPNLVDYFKAMERAVTATKLPIDLVRIDLVEGDYEISQRVMGEIDSADVVIADFTLNPRNVYFELGYARAKPCRIIQTARKDTVLEFDIRNWRTLFYRNATELEEKLIPELQAAYNELRR